MLAGMHKFHVQAGVFGSGFFKAGNFNKIGPSANNYKNSAGIQEMIDMVLGKLYCSGAKII